jgi:glutamyl-tRNA reductase
VDDLKAVVARNTAARMKEVVEAEELLREESESFVAWRESLGAVPTINMLREKADRLRAAELDKCVKKLGVQISANVGVEDQEHSRALRSTRQQQRPQL